ncbi:MAG: condensation domain-containing protein [Gordonia paraffinivorans]
MWFINQFDTSSPAYNIPAVLRLSGRIDVDALRAAVGDVVARHEVLRTRYPADATIDGRERAPRQEILSPEQARAREVLEVRDVDGLEAARVAVGELVSAGFDVASAVPVRMALLRVAPEESVLVVVVHHISADGASVAPLARDVMVAYGARHAGEDPSWGALPVQYADYALWQRAVLGDESDPTSVAARQLDFWASTLDDIPEVIDLPLDRPRPAVQSVAGAQVRFEVDASTRAGLQRLANAHGATMFMAVHAAFAVLLSRSGGTDDIVVGTAVAGRGDAALDDLVGMFVNTLALRTPVDRSAGFGTLLESVRDVDVAAFTHTEIPFERLVEDLAPERSTAFSPLFQVVLAFGSTDQPDLELPGLRVSGLEVDTTTTKFDLQLTVAQSSDDSTGFECVLTYATALFDESTVAELGRRFAAVLAAVVADPRMPVGDIDVLEPAVSERLRHMASPPAPERATLGDVFADALAADPDAAAVVAEGGRLTWSELDARARRVATVLRSRGVVDGTPVGLAIGRSVESITAFWGIVAAGGAVVPIDPNYPSERVEHMVADARITVGLTVSEVADGLPRTVGWIDLHALSELSASDGPDADGGWARPSLDELAYIIFTSGSTGRPKGRRGHAPWRRRHRRGDPRTVRGRAGFAGPALRVAELRRVDLRGAAGRERCGHADRRAATHVRWRRTGPPPARRARHPRVRHTGGAGDRARRRPRRPRGRVCRGRRLPAGAGAALGRPPRRRDPAPDVQPVRPVRGDHLVDHHRRPDAEHAAHHRRPGDGGCVWPFSTTVSVRSRPVCRASCTWPVTSSPADTSAVPVRPPSGSCPTPSVRPVRGCTAPVTWCGGGTPATTGGSWSSTAAPTSRSRCAGSASNSGRSMRCSVRSPTSTSRRHSDSRTRSPAPRCWCPTCTAA